MKLWFIYIILNCLDIDYYIFVSAHFVHTSYLLNIENTCEIMNTICIEGTLMSEKISSLFGFTNSYEN